EGLNNVDEEDIREIMVTTERHPLSSIEIREDIKNIFALGSFENVRVEIDDLADGVKLKIVIKERPVIDKIVFKGNDELGETELGEVMMLKEGNVFRKDYLESSIKFLRDKYEKSGYFNAYITYKIFKIKEDDENSPINIDIIIDEGEDIKVGKISILGANKIYVKEISGQMETKEDSIFQDGSFKKEVFEEDKRKILNYYRENGYLDAQIVGERFDYEWTNPIIQKDRCIFIILRLSEGDRYYFDGAYDVKFSEGQSKVLDDKEIVRLKESFQLQKQGELFNNTKFMMDMQSIGFTYSSRGYIQARAVPNRTVTEREVIVNGVAEKRKYVKVDFLIYEGEKAYIENIIIKGNKKTKDKVIRRELEVHEGDLFDASKMQISRETVYNLGFFKQVNFDIKPGTREDQVNLIVDVEEQPSGTISMGGGYGTAAGFSIFADVRENNFLGNGQSIGVKFEYGPKRASITLSFYERWLFDYPIGFSSSVFYYIYEYNDRSIFPNSNRLSYYKKEGLGYSLGLNYRYWYYWITGITWVHSWKTYFDPSGNSPDEVLMAVARGRQSKRTLKLYTYRDSKDNYLNPTRGWRIGATAAYTGGYLLRGDDHYSQYSPEAYFYYSPFHIPFLKSHPTVIELRASGDFITPPIGKRWTAKHRPYTKNEWLEVEDRLDIGGPETVRGWDYYDRDLADSWRYLGLYHRILYGAEYRIPIHPQMLWFALFFDAGSLWSDEYWEKQLSDDSRKYIDDDIASGKLRRINQLTDGNLLPYFIYSYGFGIRVQIPMMPLRFWFGKKMIYDDGFKTISGYNFQFGIGDMRF
ncbi:MAG: outer membrane protein assembly factor BamA, partial [Leptospirales bacterium]|nr:outer membrane protein assembly factor BamA [Leptospirales bacterium]